jgi:MULE transposase domain
VGSHSFYVIRVPLEESAIRCVYALLPNKTRSTYEELFQAVVDRCEHHDGNIDVLTVVADIQDGVLRAILAIFGQYIQSRCWFCHLTQVTWRKIRELGLDN